MLVSETSISRDSIWSPGSFVKGREIPHEYVSGGGCWGERKAVCIHSPRLAGGKKIEGDNPKVRRDAMTQLQESLKED